MALFARLAWALSPLPLSSGFATPSQTYRPNAMLHASTTYVKNIPVKHPNSLKEDLRTHHDGDRRMMMKMMMMMTMTNNDDE